MGELSRRSRWVWPRRIALGLAVLLGLLALGVGGMFAGWKWFRADGAPRGGALWSRLNGDVRSLAFAPDGTTLFASGGSHLAAYRIVTGAHDVPERWTGGGRLGRQVTDASHSLAVSFDGRTLAAATNPWWPRPEHKGTLELLDATTGKQTRLLDESFRAVDAIAFHPREPLLAVSSNAYSDEAPTLLGGAIDLWNTSTGERTASIRRTDQPLLSVSFLPDGRLLYVTRKMNAADGFHSDGEIVIQASGGGREAVIPVGRDPLLRAVQASPDGRVLAVTFDDSPVVRFFDLDGMDLGGLRAGAGLTRLRSTGAFSPDGRFFFFPTDEHAGPRFFRRWTRCVGVWSLAAGKRRRVALLPIRLDEDDFAVHALAVSPDGATLAAGFGTPYEGGVGLWDLRRVLP